MVGYRPPRGGKGSDGGGPPHHPPCRITLDLERVQKSALKVILKEKFQGYKKTLKTLDLKSLDERNLCLNFALKCTKNKKVQNLFPKNLKTHEMATRNTEKYHVNHAHTERLRKSAVIYMQKLLNEHEKS